MRSSGAWIAAWLSMSFSLDGAMASDRLREAIDLLSRSPTGKTVLERARAKWGLPENGQDWENRIRVGTVSKTDSVLVRSLDFATGKETREREVTVFLRVDQGAYLAALDLAHELTHAVLQNDWDPYDPGLRVWDYIRNGIEGAGGEADALAVECQVSFELLRESGGMYRSERCEKYRKEEDALRADRDAIVKDFYKSGIWAGDLKNHLGKISEDSPVFYSSTGGVPYPAALFREFEAITSKACENTRHRISALQEQAQASRSPASTSVFVELAQFMAARCGEKIKN